MKELNKIYIVGTGAIAKVLAVFLSNAGRDVTLIRGSVQNEPARDVLLTVQTVDGKKHEASVQIATLNDFEHLDGLVVLANKSFGNANLAEQLKPKLGSSPVVLLQNGLGVEQAFLEQGFAQIYRCVIFATSEPIDEYTLKFKVVADSPIGIATGDMVTLDAIVALLCTPQFGFRTEADIRPIIWKKAIANCAFNSMCPLLETDNGIFYRNEQAFAIGKRIIHSCVQVAQAEGIALTTAEVEASLLQISKLSDGQLISTYQDIKKGRRTEIGTLNAAIVKLAKHHQLEHLIAETKLLGELTALKEMIKLR